jgi:hypothetical protein
MTNQLRGSDDDLFTAVIKAEQVKDVPTSIVEAISSLPEFEHAEIGDVIGVSRNFFMLDGEDTHLETEAPSFAIKSAKDLKHVGFVDIETQRARETGSMAHTAFKAFAGWTNWIYSKQINEENHRGGMCFDMVATALRDAVVFVEMETTPYSPEEWCDVQSFIAARNIAVALPEGLSNHRAVRALDGAGRYLSRIMQSQVSPGLEGADGRFKIKVGL